MACPICGGNVGGGDQPYPNIVCDECDSRAVNADGDDPWHGWPPDEKPNSEEAGVRMPPDRGENPVFIGGQKRWRRYRFGGWVTMKDDHDCTSLEEFYELHG